MLSPIVTSKLFFIALGFVGCPDTAKLLVKTALAGYERYVALQIRLNAAAKAEGFLGIMKVMEEHERDVAGA